MEKRLSTTSGLMTEIEELKAQIKVLEKKLSFLEELEKTPSPAEEAYKDWWGEYPTNIFNSDDVSCCVLSQSFVLCCAVL